jgi:hypothetical protein
MLPEIRLTNGNLKLFGRGIKALGTINPATGCSSASPATTTALATISGRFNFPESSGNCTRGSRLTGHTRISDDALRELHDK